jgi:8-oxo-dGTP pyrophosphatase MutT (NUDIX family)
MEKPKSAGAIIFYIKNNEPFFLLLEYTSHWGFVKGLIEAGEEETETLKREAKEEANISELEIVPKFKESYSWFYRWEGKLINKTAVFYLAEITSKEAKDVKISFEHKSFKFLPINEALNLIKFKEDKRILKKANDLIKELKKQKKLFGILKD